LSAYTGGFSSLKFTVSEGQKTLVTDTFTSLSAAETNFTDDAMPLGKMKGAVDLTISLSLTATSAEGAGISYVLADEPSAGTSAATQGQTGDRERFGTVNPPIEMARNPLYLEASDGTRLETAIEKFNAKYARTAILPKAELPARPAAMLKELRLFTGICGFVKQRI
jgi:hypothetical protein